MKELLYLKDDQLKDLIEKLFIGYRETFSDSKKILNKYSIGLAHQKVIHLLSMYDGISISELLKKLQSLGPDMLSEDVEDTTFIAALRKKNKHNICKVLMDLY